LIVNFEKAPVEPNSIAKQDVDELRAVLDAMLLLVKPADEDSEAWEAIEGARRALAAYDSLAD